MISGIQWGLFLSALLPEPSVNRLFIFKLQLASVCSNGKRENSPIKQIIKFTFEKKKLQHTGFSFRCPLLGMFGVLPNTPTRFSPFGQNPHGLFYYSWQLGKTKKSTDFKSGAVPKYPHALGGAISLLAFEISCRLQYRAHALSHALAVWAESQWCFTWK